MDETLFDSHLQSLPCVHSGKVRDIYAIDDDRLLMVQTDRVSAFDVILPDCIPGKGAALTAMSRYWFGKINGICAHHLLADDPADTVSPQDYERIEGRSMVVRSLDPLPFEAVARGYLAGSAWNEYRDSGTVCGIRIPAGMRVGERLPEPIFTPSTKARDGEHDQNISYAKLASLAGSETAAILRDTTLELYLAGQRLSISKGLILADTKFEFAPDDSSGLILIDELLTADSSRFWPAESHRPGRIGNSLDKQLVRDWLDKQDWDKRPPAPRLPTDLIAKTAEVYAKITKIFAD